MRSLAISGFVVALGFLAAGASPHGAPPAESARSALAKLALEQSVRMTPDWAPSQRDCAGFVRYLYRSALGRGSRVWMDRTGHTTDYVGASELVAYNFDLLTRDFDPRKIVTGDLLVFFDPDLPTQDSWHVMVVLSPPIGAPDRALAVYHNGASGKDGAVKKIWVERLTEPSWAEFRPIASNPHFMGVFRWKGWMDLK